jgi:G3E family GTPase
VIQTFTADQMLAGLLRLDAVVAVVDAVHVRARLADSADAADQVALASVIVLNKVSDAPDPGAVISALRAVNPHAPILPVDRGRIEAAAVIGTHGFDLDRVAQDVGGWHADSHHRGHVAANGVASLSLTADRPLDGVAVERWLEETLLLRGADILRMKGILAIEGEERRVVVQSVHMMYEGDFGRPWLSAPRTSRLVFIGRNLDRAELRAGFERCRAVIEA